MTHDEKIKSGGILSRFNPQWEVGVRELTVNATEQCWLSRADRLAAQTITKEASLDGNKRRKKYNKVALYHYVQLTEIEDGYG